MQHTVYYTEKDVYTAAKERIERIFDDFENVLVTMSGGKDSTVVYNIAKQVATEKGRLPLRVVFIDQEAEWQCVIDFIRTIMLDKDVEPMWFQFPMRIFNATSFTDNWLWCWEEGKEEDWMRPKEPFSIRDQICPSDTKFSHIFTKIIDYYYKPDERVATLGGMRAEENPNRRAGLTSGLTYKDITWGKVEGKPPHYVFYPLYDWSYKDIWKAIYDNKWAYCPLYDYQYRDGVPIRNMRVSNLHHETALGALDYLAKVERKTWNKLTKRLGGINTYKNVSSAYKVPDQYPFMFKDWAEYRNFLVDKLVAEDKQLIYFDKFDTVDRNLEKWEMSDEEMVEVFKTEIKAILLNDYHFTTLDNRLTVIDNTQRAKK